MHAAADAGWSGNANGIGYSGTGLPGGAGSFSFNGTTAEIGNWTFNVGHNSAGNYSATFVGHVNDTGTSTYGGPVDLSQGVSAPRIPKVPSAPGIKVAVSGDLATITITPSSDNGGSAITSYVVQYSLNGGAYTVTTGGTSLTRLYSALAPGSYVFRCYAVNAIGNSPVTTAAAVTVVGGGKIRVAGAWKPTTWKVRSAGAWKSTTVKIRSAGAWKNVL
jgi:hypothetical protein